VISGQAMRGFGKRSRRVWEEDVGLPDAGELGGKMSRDEEPRKP